MSVEENTSVLPTDRLAAIVAMFHTMEEALIEIASAFQGWSSDGEPRCIHCDAEMTDVSCWDWCPGLLARRALGVA